MNNEKALKIKLNKEQEMAVVEKSQSLLVLAGAGTGKTRFLCAKITHLLDEGVDRDSIIAITFTKKAGKEMLDRVEKYSGGKNISFIGTFHSLGANILRSFGSVIDVPINFSIADNDDSISIVRRFLRQQNLETKKARGAYQKISKFKRFGITPESFSEEVYEPFNTKVFLKIWNNYENELKDSKMLDFDDLISRTVFLLKENESVRKKFHKKYKHILVDEFQDIDFLQSELIQLLKGSDSNLYAVGDMDQNIYSWRGSDPLFALSFAETYKPSKVFKLEENYRSTNTIVSAASSVISNNKIRLPRNLRTKKGLGEKISICMHKNADIEASFIAEEIARLREGGVKYSDIAVLYRNNFQSRILERVFLYENIPNMVIGQRFFARMEIKDICAYLRYICIEKNKIDLERIINIPSRGIGEKSKSLIFEGKLDKLSPKARESYRKFSEFIEKTSEFAKNNSLKGVAKRIIEAIGYSEHLSSRKEDADDRMLNIKELLISLEAFEGNATETAPKFFESIALSTDQDEIVDESGKVTLMTIHTSKGLEYSHIFVVGLEEGLFPSLFFDENEAEKVESERRLFYVALTRAKEKVYLCSSQTRSFGKDSESMPSRFLGELPEEFVSYGVEDLGKAIEF